MKLSLLFAAVSTVLPFPSIARLESQTRLASRVERDLATDLSFSMIKGGMEHLHGSSSKSGKSGKSTKDGPDEPDVPLCFQTYVELKTAVDQYVERDCANDRNCAVGVTYGYPMNS